MIDHTDRGRERYRRAAKTSAMILIAEGVRVITLLAMVPLSLAYLGEERFGLWMALSSLVAALTFADIGIGAGLQNAIAECHGRDDHDAPRSYVSAALLVVASLSLAVVAAALLAVPWLPLERWLPVRDPTARGEVEPTAIALLLCIAIGLPAGLAQRIHNGYQEGYVAKVWMTAGRALAFGGVLLCIALQLGLPSMAAAYAGLPFAVMIVAGLVLFRRRPWLAPAPRAITRPALRRIARTGLAALFVQLGFVLATNGMPLVIASRLGAQALPPFSITASMLWIPALIVQSAALPLWPAYREARARGDRAWIAQAFARSVRRGALVLLPCLALALVAGRPAIRLWTGVEGVVPDLSLLAALCAWAALNTWSTLCMVLLNGLERMRAQAIYGCASALAALAVGAALAPEGGVGAAAWALVGCCGVPRAILHGIDVARALRGGR